MREQLGRDMRAVVSIARRCACGRPAVVRTAPRLEDGTPFPTSLYLTLPWLTLELSRLEAGGIMAEFSDRLTAEEELAAGYLRAHERYLARREELGTAEEIRAVSAGGMPVRAKGLHALAGQALAEGPGINPVADEVLAGLGADDQQLVCRCEQGARWTTPPSPRSPGWTRSPGRWWTSNAAWRRAAWDTGSTAPAASTPRLSSAPWTPHAATGT